MVDAAAHPLDQAVLRSLRPDPGYDDALALVIRLNQLLDSLCIKGLRALDSEDLARLSAQADALASIGAAELATRLRQLTDHLREGSRDAAAEAFRARASIRVFERLLSLRIAGGALASGLQAAIADDPQGI